MPTVWSRCQPLPLEAPHDEAGLAEREPAPSFECDGCGERVPGHPAGSGLFLWSRGDEVRYEEPPLCEGCAERLGLLGELHFAHLEDDEG